MKAVILAGGLGTRLSEETAVRPKPMVEIGGRPILWHIMKIYSCHGINDFIICCGYKGHLIKEYFANYLLYRSDITFDIKSNDVQVHQNGAEPWRVTLVDTGTSTMTGGRLLRIRDYLDGEPFCFTYGDGLADVNIGQVVRFHREQNATGTLVAVQPPGRFGVFSLPENESHVSHFREKPRGDGAWVNGGFFVLEPEALGYVDDDQTVWEKEPMERMAANDALAAFRHYGFWQPMDTLRDKVYLERLWDSGSPPWKVWED